MMLSFFGTKIEKLDYSGTGYLMPEKLTVSPGFEKIGHLNLKVKLLS